MLSGISSKAAETVENKKGFNGNEIQNKEFSDGSGLELYDFNARTYDQQIGRFIQIDPLGEDGGQESLTPYQLGLDNPIRYNDPDGKCPVCPLPWIGEAIYAGGVAVVSYFTAKAAAPIIQKGAENAGKALREAGAGAGTVPPASGGSAAQQDFAIERQLAKAQGSQNPKTKESAEVGQEAHRQIQNDLKKEGAKTEVPMTLKDGSNVRKDAVRPDGTPVIIKPDTKTGNASADKREQLLNKNGVKTPEKIFYNPNDPKYKPGSSTYIGPKKQIVN